MYGATVEKLQSLAKEAIPGFDCSTDRRAKVLHELEIYLAKLDKESDMGLSILKQVLDKLVIKAPVVSRVTSTIAVATLKKEFELNGNIGEFYEAGRQCNQKGIL